MLWIYIYIVVSRIRYSKAYYGDCFCDLHAFLMRSSFSYDLLHQQYHQYQLPLPFLSSFSPLASRMHKFIYAVNVVWWSLNNSHLHPTLLSQLWSTYARSGNSRCESSRAPQCKTCSQSGDDKHYKWEMMHWKPWPMRYNETKKKICFVSWKYAYGPKGNQMKEKRQAQVNTSVARLRIDLALMKRCKKTRIGFLSHSWQSNMKQVAVCNALYFASAHKYVVGKISLKSNVYL